MEQNVKLSLTADEAAFVTLAIGGFIGSELYEVIASGEPQKVRTFESHIRIAAAVQLKLVQAAS